MIWKNQVFGTLLWDTWGWASEGNLSVCLGFAGRQARTQWVTGAATARGLWSQQWQSGVVWVWPHEWHLNGQTGPDFTRPCEPLMKSSAWGTVFFFQSEMKFFSLRWALKVIDAINWRFKLCPCLLLAADFMIVLFLCLQFVSYGLCCFSLSK